MSELGQLVAKLLSSAWGSAFVWFGALWAVVSFIRRVTKDADNELNPERRQLLADSLTRSSHLFSGSWIPDFTVVFDRFFGNKHISWRCFYRSSLISIFSVLVLSALFFRLSDINARPTLPNYLIVFTFFSFAAIACNVIIDYLSLLQTRYLIKLALPVSVKLVVDALLTFLLSIFWIGVIGWMIATWFSPSYLYLKEQGLVTSRFDQVIRYPEEIRPILSGAWIHLTGEGEGTFFMVVLRIIVATSFTTSIWLWLHGLSQLTVKALWSAGWVMSWLDVKENPLRAIGTTINVFLVLIACAMFPVFVVFR